MAMDGKMLGVQTTWNDRMAVSRKATGLSKTDFSKMIGVSGATITEWENGNIKTLSAENLLRACKLMNLSPYWVLFGESNGDSSVQIVEKVECVPKLSKAVQRIALRLESLPSAKLKALEVVLGLKLTE